MSVLNKSLKIPSIFKNKYLAFVYNVRHSYPNLNKPETFLETDFDDQETIDAFIGHLQKLGFNVLPIEANLEAEKILKKNKDKIALVFNYSEKIVGLSPKTFMAEVYEKLKIPFTGCTNSTQKLIMNKVKMTEYLLKKGVTTLPSQLFTNSRQKLSSEMYFPLIVKPISEGSSAGITNKSVVTNDRELRKQVDFVIKTFDGYAMVEPFLSGREFSVGMVGNPPKLMPIIEPNHSKLPKGYYPLDSLEVKWIFEEEIGANYFDCPAKVDSKLKKTILGECLKTWKALKIQEFCRIDLRMNGGDSVYVLDVNSPPGLIPPEITETGYLPYAAGVNGISYDELLLKIISSAVTRLKLK